MIEAMSIRSRRAACLVGGICLGLLVSEPVLPLTCARIQPPAYKTVIEVSPTGSDIGTCGPSGTPCLTIQQGIGRCANQDKNTCAVFVRYGSYTVADPVNLANGVDVYGSCVFDESDPRYRTIVTGLPAFAADRLDTKTLLEGFVIVGANATRPGQASIAMTVTNSSGLAIRRSVLVSGRGGTGFTPLAVNGTAGENGTGVRGNAGGMGGRACAANPTATGMGGQGADFQQVDSYTCVLGCQCSNNNYPASLGKNGADSGAVKGGAGGPRSGQLGCMCGRNGDPGDGPPGSAGHAGACGNTGGTANPNTKGVFNTTAWSGTQGGAGSLGQVGSGGGGGGSGGMATNVGGPDFPGLPGGGGGGGGCGGNGGQGGGQGGGSIPLVLSKSKVAGLASDNALIPGPAGMGGSGALGGSGGSGGQGAMGPKGHYSHVEQWAYCSGNPPGSGGEGGAGGQGGAGSGGAGGNGGPSAGLALINSENAYSGVVIYPTQPGANGTGAAGGQNSSSQCSGARGQNGLAGSSDAILIFSQSLADSWN